MANSFCLDIGEKFMRITDAVIKNNLIEVANYGEIEGNPFFYNSDTEKNIELQVNAINTLLGKLKIQSKNVNIIIPDSFSYSQTIEVPKLNEKELQSAIRYQADQFIPMPIDDVSLDIEVLKEDPVKKTAKVLLVACPKKISSQIEKTVDACGLYPQVLENEFSAIRRLLIDYIKFPLLNSSLFVNIGTTGSSIYLFDTISATFINRTIKVGLELFYKDLELNLNVDEKKALEILKNIGFEKNSSVDVQLYLSSLVNDLTEEIKRMLILAKERFNFKVEKIYLLNQASLIKSLDKKISEGIGLGTEYFNLDSYLVKNTGPTGIISNSLLYVNAIAGNLS